MTVRTRYPLVSQGSDGALLISGAVTSTGGATEATLATRLSEATFDTKTGSLTETAPATDTASSGLNGRLQRIAQRLTSLVALLPAALVGGRLDTNTGAWLGSTAPTVGQKAMASSVPIAIASDQSAVPVSATHLDVRDLTFAADKVDASGSTGVGVTGPLTDAQLRATPVPVSGTVTASGPLTDAQLRATAVPVSGSVTALDEDAATGTSTNVAGTGANVTILASNAARKGATIYNASAVTANVKLGATASATSFSIAMVAASYYEVPFKYTGIIDGFWMAGDLRVTELT